jgi:hypothetical protein
MMTMTKSDMISNLGKIYIMTGDYCKRNPAGGLSPQQPFILLTKPYEG